jgi:predicted transcriptional regulator of viral defense system
MNSGRIESLFDLAAGQDGYFSTAQAVAEGVSRHTLAKAAARGAVVRLSRGVYRLARYPEISANSYLWRAILWTQVRTNVIATLSHETALLLHDLSDVNTEEIHITVPRALRVRRTPGRDIIVHRSDLAKHEVQYVDGFLTTTIERTLRDIARAGNSVLLHDALRDARMRGLTIPVELADA